MHNHPDACTNCSTNYVTHICPNSWAISGSHAITNSESYCGPYGSAQLFTDSVPNCRPHCRTDSSSLYDANRIA
jgi:hypothetical protein